MKTDRELLGLAALACGVNLCVFGPPGSERYGDSDGFGRHASWNPLTDDGDALRLAGKLRVRISISDTHEFTEVTWFPEFGKKRLSGSVVEKWGEDRNAATRRAIVRAAAEIGAEQTK